MTPQDLQLHYLDQISLPKRGSHKGQNGKVMVIGGSALFHAASQWALSVVSRMVDMVFYSSVPSNNQLVQDAKANFSNGIVIRRSEIEAYINEADVVLIGPGMERSGQISNFQFSISNGYPKPSESEWDNNTQKIVNYLLSKYPDKKWVVDAGALQMVDPMILNAKCIITPHQGEFEMLVSKIQDRRSTSWQAEVENLQQESSNIKTLQPYNLATLQPIEGTILLKGQSDLVLSPQSSLLIPGGNVGMTKGGTGDVLAGLVAGLYCFTTDPFAAAVVGSHLNKKAGDELFRTVGPFFNASDLANQLPKTLADVFQYT